MAVIYSWVSFEYHLGYLGCHFGCHFGCHLGCHLECHYIFSLYLTFTSLYLILTSLYSILTSLNLTLQVTPLLTKIKSHEIIIFHKKNII